MKNNILINQSLNNIHFYDKETNKGNVVKLIQLCKTLQAQHNKEYGNDDEYLATTIKLLVSYLNPKANCLDKALLLKDVDSAVKKFDKNNSNQTDSVSSAQLTPDASSTPKMGTEPTM